MGQRMDPQCYDIIGAAMHVHRVLGHGFLENVYHEALMIEFQKRNIPFEHEVDIHIEYDGVILKSHYRADFVCYDSIIIEIKALSKVSKAEFAQIYNYLKATGFRRGVLLNFGGSSLEYNRVTNKFLNSTNSKNSRQIIKGLRNGITLFQ